MATHGLTMTSGYVYNYVIAITYPGDTFAFVRNDLSSSQWHINNGISVDSPSAIFTSTDLSLTVAKMQEFIQLHPNLEFQTQILYIESGHPEVFYVNPSKETKISMFLVSMMDQNNNKYVLDIVGNNNGKWVVYAVEAAEKIYLTPVSNIFYSSSAVRKFYTQYVNLQSGLQIENLPEGATVSQIQMESFHFVKVDLPVPEVPATPDTTEPVSSIPESSV